jgi:hypothetical protein
MGWVGTAFGVWALNPRFKAVFWLWVSRDAFAERLLQRRNDASSHSLSPRAISKFRESQGMTSKSIVRQTATLLVQDSA